MYTYTVIFSGEQIGVVSDFDSRSDLFGVLASGTWHLLTVSVHSLEVIGGSMIELIVCSCSDNGSLYFLTA